MYLCVSRPENLIPKTAKSQRELGCSLPSPDLARNKYDYEEQSRKEPETVRTHSSRPPTEPATEHGHGSVAYGQDTRSCGISVPGTPGEGP